MMLPFLKIIINIAYSRLTLLLFTIHLTANLKIPDSFQFFNFVFQIICCTFV